MEHENGRKKWSCGGTDVVLPVLSLLFLIGMGLRFHACAPKEDGTFMTCHWAQMAVGAFAEVIFGLSLLHLLFSSAQMKQGLDFGIAFSAAAVIFVPGKLIELCMMADMDCRRLMRPYVIVCGILLLVTAIIDLVVQRKRGGVR